jgi:nitrite reductase/ring-hydroxylating ferredoxin subunit
MSAWVELCRLDEVPLDGARAFAVAERSLIVMRLEQQRVQVYLNRCPHLGIPLQWDDSGFLDPDRAFIQCSTHGALFEKDTGLCVLGPCRDASLWLVDSQVQNGAVLIDRAELPAPRPSDY